ncbi:nitrite reductase small subunit NirD [Haloechinothrix salitolerans]|uniref:Nitrite reductase small subunit NirD n=1 Tax=Haloechinothrix salitolerans TaxID=926830 RepID=A0ABW2CAE3_9PSEU
MTVTDARTWTAVCELARIPVAAGVAALLPGGEQVAVFRTEADDVYAIGNIDPIGGAAVLSRGIVGDADGVPVVASPLYKERFDLRTGECLDGDASVPTYPVRITEGVVHVGSV